MRNQHKLSGGVTYKTAKIHKNFEKKAKRKRQEGGNGKRENGDVVEVIADSRNWRFQSKATCSIIDCQPLVNGVE